MATVKTVGDKSPNIAGLGIARLIREEVQAGIKSVYETFYAPPSYESSAPLLNSSPDEDDADAEGQQETGASDHERGHTPETFLIWVKLFVTLSPLLAMIFSFPVLIGTGIDPLAFSMLAFIQVLALMWYIIIVRLFSLAA
jgi:hypothetical protein